MLPNTDVVLSGFGTIVVSDASQVLRLEGSRTNAPGTISLAAVGSSASAVTLTAVRIA